MENAETRTVEHQPIVEIKNPSISGELDDEWDDERATKFIKQLKKTGIPELADTVPPATPKKTNKNKKTFIWSPESSVVIYREQKSGSENNSGSGSLRAKSLLNAWTSTNTDNQNKFLRNQSRIYQYISQQSITIAQRYSSNSDINYLSLLLLLKKTLFIASEKFTGADINRRLQEIQATANSLFCPYKSAEVRLISHREDIPKKMGSNIFLEKTNDTIIVYWRGLGKTAIASTSFNQADIPDIINLLPSSGTSKNEALIDGIKTRCRQASPQCNLATIFTIIDNTVKQYYRTLSYAAKLFKNFLLAEILTDTGFLERSQDYLTDSGNINAFLKEDIEILHSNFKLQFQDIEIAIQEHCTSHTFARLMFENFLLAHIYDFNIIKVDYTLIPEKINMFWQIFTLQLQPIIDTLPPSIPLWQTWYLLWFHELELLAQENPRALTIEKFRALSLASHQNSGQGGVELANNLMQQLPADLSNCYFKQDPKTKQKIFRTRADMEQTVSRLQYNPFQCCYLTFYRQTKETLDVFSQKKEKSC